MPSSRRCAPTRSPRPLRSLTQVVRQRKRRTNASLRCKYQQPRDIPLLQPLLDLVLGRRAGSNHDAVAMACQGAVRRHEDEERPHAGEYRSSVFTIR